MSQQVKPSLLYTGNWNSSTVMKSQLSNRSIIPPFKLFSQWLKAFSHTSKCTNGDGVHLTCHIQLSTYTHVKTPQRMLREKKYAGLKK